MGVLTLQGIVVNLTVTEQTCSHCHDKFGPAYLKAQATLFWRESRLGVSVSMSLALGLGRRKCVSAVR